LPTQSYYIDDGERLVVAGYTEWWLHSGGCRNVGAQCEDDEIRFEPIHPSLTHSYCIADGVGQVVAGYPEWWPCVTMITVLIRVFLPSPLQSDFV
jgi:hypothetical protein